MRSPPPLTPVVNCPAPPTLRVAARTMSARSPPRTCAICRSSPTDAFSTRCAHIFCYECITTHLTKATTCPNCASYLTVEMLSPAAHTPPRTPDAPAAAHRSSPPPLNPHPRPQLRADAAERRARAQAVADAAVASLSVPRTPLTHSTAAAAAAAAAAAFHPVALQPAAAAVPAAVRGSEQLLAAGEQLNAEQLAGVIAQLQQKLEQKEDVERRVENDLLLDFLRHVRTVKQTMIHRLQREVSLLDDDVSATELQRARFTTPETSSTTSCASSQRREGVALESSPRATDAVSRDPRFTKKRKRLSRNYDVLQSHYFSTVASQKGEKRARALQSFKDDISKLTQFTRFRDTATLMHVARVPDVPCRDVFKASNIVSSIEFDRESELLATAGVTKRIKIFEFSNVTRNLSDVHYPIREIKTNAKLSWICWNPYIRHLLVSSDYEGVVALWDISQSEALRVYEEHERRVWSVDYCPSKPTVFASGSDDCRVKLWCTSQRSSVLTIDNSPANVCSVKFHPTLPEKIAFGSVDSNIHYYDLRMFKQPIHVFESHKRAVSYVKFMSPTSLVSASVDSTIKLWDLNTMKLERNFTGHTNDRNFVGLSVTPDYIACGSEKDTVYCYYKAIPRPITGYRFLSVDPLTGKEIQDDDDDSQFVSSVCWCPKDPTKLVAANSLGTIKVLSLESDDRGEEDGEQTRE